MPTSITVQVREPRSAVGAWNKDEPNNHFKKSWFETVDHVFTGSQIVRAVARALRWIRSGRDYKAAPTHIKHALQVWKQVRESNTPAE